MSRLIVFNLPKSITKNELKETFSQKGNVTNVQLIFTVDLEFCYFALIAFETEDEAIATLNYFNKRYIFSTRISVERCSEIVNENYIDNRIENSKRVICETQDIEINQDETIKNLAPVCLRSYLTNLPYEEDQWSPNNPTGKRVYSKSFLFSLENKTVCQNKPILTDNYWGLIIKSSNLSQNTVNEKKNYDKNIKSGLQMRRRRRSLPSYLKNLPYEKGQWSPTNPTGKKVYSKSFLLHLESKTVCQKKHMLIDNYYWGPIIKVSNLSQNTSLISVSSFQKHLIIYYYESLKCLQYPMDFQQMITYISKNLDIHHKHVLITILEYDKIKTKNKMCDEIEKNAIRRKIHSFWFKNEVPTFEKVLVTINVDTTLPNFLRTNFEKLLTDLDFKSGLTLNSILTERSDIVNWRRKYLSSIRQFRNEKRPIYYLSETSINTNYLLSKTEQNKTSHRAFPESLATDLFNPLEEKKRLILLQNGSDNILDEQWRLHYPLLFFEPKKNTSDLYSGINGFYDWFEEILSQLKDNAVVVMDNSLYNSIRSEKIPNMRWKKGNIVDWLLSNGKKVDPNNMVKNDLMEIVKQIKPKFRVLDSLGDLKTVLIIPPYHYELIPNELAWSIVEQYLEKNNTTLKSGMKCKSVYQTYLYPIQKKDQQLLISHVKRVEKTFWEVDFLSDLLLDELESYCTNNKIIPYSSDDY